MAASRTAARSLAALLWLFPLVGARAAAVGVFDAPGADYESAPPRSGQPADDGVLRWIWVEERMDRARVGAPVRVPIFLAAGECGEPDQLAVVRWPSREAVPVQWDDIRRGPDGGVARLHGWFTTDLQPGERQRWALVRRDASPSPAGRAVGFTAGERIRISARDTSAEFFAHPGPGGALAALRLAGGPVLEFPAGAGPTLATGDAAGTGESRSVVTAATGPVFAKVKVAQVAGGLNLVQVYRLFGDGSLDLIQTIDAGDQGTPAVAAQAFLSGELGGGPAVAVDPQPAGIVAGLENFHAGYAVDTVLQAGRTRGWVVMPGTMGGAAGRVVTGEHGRFELRAPAGFDAGRTGQRAYWAEVTLRPADRPALRATVLEAAQPLVAVVDRPDMTREIAAARIIDNVREMKPIGWINETVIRSLAGEEQPFPRRRWAAESDPAYWAAAARREKARITAGGEDLREDEKGRAAGPLDPYHITYGSTPLVTWLGDGTLPPPAGAALRAQLTAVREELGRTDADGTPYLDVFNRAQNMQMGPALLALADPALEPAVRRFYRELIGAPVVRAVLARGFRPYEGRPQLQPNESDTIYQAIVDFLLRAAELATGESLGVQPVAYGRYLDAVDVTADLYVPAHPRNPDDARHFARANFFRAQSHQHRWLGWGPAPFIALLRPPAAGGETPGATEAWRYADQLAGRWKNWPDQSWLYLAAKLSAVAARPGKPTNAQAGVASP